MSQRVKKKASPMARQEAVAGYVFILPTILLYLCLTIIPIIVTFSLSFMDYDLVKPSTFIGFDNYIKLFQDSRLGQVALNTVLFALMSVVGNVGIGLLLAVILNRKMPKFFVNFFRFSFFLPVVIGYVYVSIVWSNLYSTDTGVFNYFLSLLGLEKVGWLTNKSIVLFSIILMDIWKNAGFFMVIFLAGLQNVPRVYHEAAEIDGANAWQRFWHVTFPSMTPIIFYNMLMSLITNMQVVTPALALTKGGPGKSSYFMSYMLYNYAFKQRGKIGLACAIAFVLFLLIGAFTLLLFATSKSWIFYEGGDDK